MSEERALVMALTEEKSRSSGATPLVPVLSARGVLICLVFVIIFVLNVFGSTDPDFWWHLRTGQYIFDSHTVPGVDLFSHTFQGQPRVAQEWASEVLLLLPFRWFGYGGDVLLFASAVTATFFLLYRLCIKLGVNDLVAAVVVFWGAALARPMFTVRPLVFSWLFFAIFLASLYLYHRGRVRRLWHLPLMMILWVNLHGGFVVGLGLIGLLILAKLIDGLVMKKPAQVGRLLIVLGLSVAATLVSPNGLGGIAHPLSYAGFANPSAQFISEWQSPDFHELYWLLLLASLLTFMILGLANRRLGAWPVMLIAVLSTMSLQSTRHIPLYAMAMAPVLGEALEDRFNFRAKAVQRLPSRALGYANWSLLTILVAGAFFFAVLSPYSQLKDLPVPSRGVPYPAAGAEYIRANYPEARMFNEYNWGGYLIYALYPGQLVFVDGRTDLYSDALLNDYNHVVLVRPDWRTVLDRYGIDLVLVQRGSTLSVVLAEDSPWQRVFTGEIETIFVRAPVPRAGS